MLENKLFEALLDVVPFGAYAVDKETFEVVYANKIIRENMYAPQEEKCWEKLYGRESKCEWCTITQENQKDIKQTHDFFDELDDKWIKSYDEFIGWPDGRDVKYSILVDITDEKHNHGSMIQSHAKLAVKTKQVTKTNKNLQITKLQLQKTVRELEEQTTSAQQATQSKSDFLANMSHEIRTPMNGILGMTHLAIQSDDIVKQKEYIQKIDSSAKNLLGIINDILDFSKIEAGKFDIEYIDFDMKSVIINLKNITELKAYEKDLKYHIFYDKNDSIYNGDPTRIGQVLINLVNNAIKFTNEGTVSVYIENLENNWVKFRVVDSGIGITTEAQKKLFTSFSQADTTTTRKYGGSGLGLSISKKLVELMGGTIELKSEYGIGSEFIFEIPLAQGDESFIKKEEKSLKKLQKEVTLLKGNKILLVEDNDMNRDIVHSLLEITGIEIVDAFNGEIAVELYKETPDDYSLILMDIQMPVMDGYEASRIIRESGSKIPIIALSANAMKEDIDRVKKIGMDEHLAKPIDIEKLYETLLKYLPKKSLQHLNNAKSVDDLEIPKFKHIDTVIGLNHLAGNKKLYRDLLEKFYKSNKDLKLEELNIEEFKIKIHTLKGLSATIGATNIHIILDELEITQDKLLLPKVYDNLELVLDELKIYSIENIDKSVDKMAISDSKRPRCDLSVDKLFLELKKWAKTSRSQQCNIVIETLNNYHLNNEDSKLFKDVKEFIRHYKFKEAVNILKERYP